MLKIIFTVIFSCSTMLSYAQEYKKFHVLIGGGLAIPVVNVGLEAAISVSETVSIGMKMDASLVFISALDAYSNFNLGDVTSASGYLKVYLIKAKVRPYIGIGAGEYQLGFGEKNHTKFGYYPRFGMEVKRLSLNVDYNIIGSVNHTSGPNWEVGYGNNNYIVAKVSFMIGGG